ncbi:MAG TPA: hypothetical protein VMF30_12115 [Pirellulales bacterium]|nr:hypothetical protein [Pirellulales bacterium]
MTAVDRAFIKAYAAGRSGRNAASETRVLPSVEMAPPRGVPSYRVDAAHAAVRAPAATLGKPTGSARLPDEHAVAGSRPQTATTVEHLGRERLVVSLGDTAIPPDWIWERQPHPVFADRGSAVSPTVVAAPPATPMPTRSAAVAEAPPPSRLQPLTLPTPRSQPLAPEPAKIDPPRPEPARPEPVQPQPLHSQPAESLAVQPSGLVAESANPNAEISKLPASRILSPEILSLSMASLGAAAPKTLPATAPRGAVQSPAPGTAGPLSLFTPPRVEEPLQPALEVDQFLWPAEIDQLCDRAATGLNAFASKLMDAARRGRRRVALVGATQGAGTTTVVLCLARLAKAKQATWGLLDAAIGSPALAPRLGIAQATGWQAVLAGRERLADVSIASLDDRLILVPLSNESLDPRGLQANLAAATIFSTLAEAVDLMLVDAGAVNGHHPGALAALVRAARLDAIYLVYDERATTGDELATLTGRLQAAGVTVAGTIASFEQPTGAI